MAGVAQLAEHMHGKHEVTGSSPVPSSIKIENGSGAGGRRKEPGIGKKSRGM